MEEETEDPQDIILDFSSDLYEANSGILKALKKKNLLEAGILVLGIRKLAEEAEGKLFPKPNLTLQEACAPDSLN